GGPEEPRAPRRGLARRPAVTEGEEGGAPAEVRGGGLGALRQARVELDGETIANGPDFQRFLARGPPHLFRDRLEVAWGGEEEGIERVDTRGAVSVLTRGHRVCRWPIPAWMRTRSPT